MAPELDQSALSQDLQILSRTFEALKLMDRDSGYARGEYASNTEPLPDGHVLSNGNIGLGSNANRSTGSLNENGENGRNNGIFNGDGGNDDHDQYQPNNVSSSDNIGRNIMDNVKVFFRNPPSLDASSIINKEMLKYNVTERNAIYEEVHGVGNLCPDESQPGMIEKALDALVYELDVMPAHQKKEYTQSLSMPHSYIHTREFRLRFLRADLFDAKRAANRLVTCLQTMCLLYGPYALERPIRLSDFSKKELKVFNAGRIQLLPYRDRGGRRVAVGIPSQKHNLHNPVTRAKIHFYLWWVASKSVETQRKGVVVVTFHNPAISDATPSSATTESVSSAIDRDEDFEEIRGLPSLRFAKIYVMARRGMPIRVVAFHTCTPDTPYYSIIRAYNSAMVEERARLKFHIGEDIENRYKLSGYGIPLDQLPITESGKLKNMHFKKWIQLRKTIESSNTMIENDLGSIIECPNLKDVVFRPSQSTMCHPGNVMFRSLVESKHFEHSIAPNREAKIDVTRSVMIAVKQLGGRFLVWNNETWWTEITDEKVIYSKIAVFFRNSKVSAKAKSNRQTTKSSTYIFADQDKRRKIDFGGDMTDETCFGFV
eukprot:CAMPEP_0116087644 /NCGR_PEP_ID=MMETSP0327-20121206/5468_1 /TAXON_ID=44447 /ORGANISM="Pseudo-nitzschia delicatissima, Strain B596" /LENGTH=598 /DNA_ID=CAMNT_0003578715 /DNA_START=114 /DNA_END=1910 /DNA_ORIENTATION=-